MHLVGYDHHAVAAIAALPITGLRSLVRNVILIISHAAAATARAGVFDAGRGQGSEADVGRVSADAGAAAVIAALFYKMKKTRARAYIALGLFLLAQVLVMIPMNYFVGSLNFVLFFGVPTYAAAREAMAPLLGWVALFNLIKGSATVLVTALVYKPLSRTVLSKDLLMPAERKETQE